MCGRLFSGHGLALAGFAVGLGLLLPFADGGTLGFRALAADVAPPPAVSSSVVVVTTKADVANGDVSSVAALNANPGSDGISLREALEATDATGGSATVYLMFSAALNGATIEVLSELPPINRDHVVLEGVAPDGSSARVTLDGLDAPSSSLGNLLYVEASDVTVRRLRFTGVHAMRQAVVVWPGTYNQGAPPHPPGPSLIANVQIVDDVFDNSNVPLPPTPTATGPQGLYVGTEGGGSNLHISGITIARNTFRNYGGDGVAVLETDPGATADGVLILDNTFEGPEISIELGLGSQDAERITGTQIIGNTFFGGGAINLDAAAQNGTIDQTLIQDNVLSGTQGAVSLNAEAWLGPPGPEPFGTVISNTRIVNNVAHASGTIYIQGGNTTTATPNRVSGVTIENDTFVNDLVNNEQQQTMFVAIPNEPGASGNQITDVSVINSIFYEPSGNPIWVSSEGLVSQPPDVVKKSFISGPLWAGSNGNINGDPLFVDEPGGDYHLTAGSPLIDAGTTIGAPADDLDGGLRDATPDIGAFEFGAAPRPKLTVMVEQFGGSGTVTTTPAGIACHTGCSARFDHNSTVTLTAAPASGSVFAGWSGGSCSGTGGCTVTMGAAQTVTARFIAPPMHSLTITQSGSGGGTVTINPAHIACTATCSYAFDSGTPVTLTAAPAAGSTFGGWSGGGCSGTGACTVTMSAEQSVTAAFNAQPPGTKITSARINRAKHRATFMFKAIGGQGSGFQCELKRKHQRASFTKCGSPKTYKHLKRGSYTFEVRAVGPGGHDPTPARKSFTIK
ncbi:MAG: InlB B-repeat-containing protein [Gaiellaceae bacterium]